MNFPSFLKMLRSRWSDDRSHRRSRPRTAQGRPRLNVEALEDRTLMAVLPAAVVVPDSQSPLNGTHNPSLAIDPTNPDRIVMVSGAGTDLDGSYSVTGGVDWESLGSIRVGLLDPTSPINNLTAYPQATNPSVAFDRSGNFYTLHVEHDAANTRGALVLQKFTFASDSVGRPTIVAIDLDPNTFGNHRVLYEWFGADPVLNPVIAVNNNLPFFRDPDTGEVQADPYASFEPIYVAWNTNNTLPTVPPPNTSVYQTNASHIKMMVSTDGGLNFSSQLYVSDGGGSVQPQIVFTQGTADGRVPGGQMTVLWQTAGGNIAIETNRDSSGGLNSQTAASAFLLQDFFLPINDPIVPASGPHSAVTTTFPISVNITNPDFFSLADLDVVVNLQNPHMSQVRIDLEAPNGVIVRLLDNRVDANNANRPNVTPPGLFPPGLPNVANLGMVALPGQTAFDFHYAIGTVFDQQAVRSITDPSATAPFVSHFRPDTGSFNSGGLNAFNGMSLADVNGIWRLHVTDVFNSNENPKPPQYLESWGLRLTSIDSSAIVGHSADRLVATTGIPGSTTGNYPNPPAASPVRGIGPAPSIAIDNTLGSFSPYQGRMYVAYTAANQFPAFLNFLPNSQVLRDTDINLVWSDDGGRTWSNPVIVNDDPLQGSASEINRLQFMPTVAVDPVTGTLVVTWYDTRDDAANARPATYIATSIDGGQTFSPQRWLNDSHTAIDAVTGQTVVLGPIPSNQSTGNAGRDTVFGFGDHQALVVYGGQVIAAWSGDTNGAGRSIQTASVQIAAGPRIVSGDMGPVVNDFVYIDPTTGVVTPYNNTFTSDGTRLIDGFLVRFDRPIDPNSFTADDVQVQFRPADPLAFPNLFTVPVTDIQALDEGTLFGPAQVGGIGELATTFLVRVDTTLLDNPVGTYSYAIGPNIRDRIRSTTGILDIQTSGPTQMFTSTDVPRNVPPAFGSTTTSSLTIPLGSFPPDHRIADVNVHLTISHSWVGDLRLTLISPTGQRILLSGEHGGSGDNYTSTIFDDQASLAIGSGVPPFTGRFRPDQPLSALYGQAYEGTWRLELQDVFVLADDGVLLDWSLEITTFAPQTFVSTDFPQAIPSVGTTTSTLTVPVGAFPAGEVLTDVDVTLSLTHTFVGELRLTLISPSGTRILLSNRRGGPGDDYTLTMFDDQAPTLIRNGTAPFTGRFRPEQPLASLIGEDPAGIWTLEVEDGFGIDAGQLGEWSVTLTTGVLQFRSSKPVPAGRYQHFDALASEVNKIIPDLAGSGVPQTLVSTNVPLSIPLGAPTTTEGARTSTLTVPVGTFPAGQSITDLNVNLSLTHTRVSDLRISLIAPNGLRIILADQRGGFNADYTNTVFDDEAADAIADGSAPFTGSFRPEQPLSSFNGLSPAGTWQLVIEDLAADEVGELTSWSLTFLTGNIAPITSTITIPIDAPQFTANQTIADVRVNLNLTHTNTSDLQITLISPNGTRVSLARGRGTATGPGTGFINTTFDANVYPAIDPRNYPTALATGITPYTGSYRPERFDEFGGPNSLNELIGEDPHGVWTLEILDLATFNQGRLVSWSLDILPGDPGPLDGIQRGNWMDQNADGRTKRTAEDVFAMPTPINGEPFVLPYKQDTLPLIVPGPHLALPQTFQPEADQLGLRLPAVGNGGSGVAANDTVESALMVTGYEADRQITDVNVNISLRHNHVSDLIVTLIAPDGTEVVLIRNRPQSSSGTPLNGIHLANTTFDDQASQRIAQGNYPFIGTFRPEQPLTAFNGKSPNGTWLLRIQDIAGGTTTLIDVNGNPVLDANGSTQAVGTIGQLDSWSLTFDTTRVIVNGSAEFLEVTFDRDMDLSSFSSGNIVRVLGPTGEIAGPFLVFPVSQRTFQIRFPSPLVTSGTYSVVLGPDSQNQYIRDLRGNAVDMNLNAGLYALRGVDPTSGSVVPVIAQNTTPLALAPGQSIVSAVSLTDNFAIQSTRLRLNIVPTGGNLRSSDLSAVLIAPDGTRIQLFTQVGLNQAGPQGFLNTEFTDLAPTPIQNGVTPFTGPHNPQQPLSQLLGKGSAGVWMLEITNNSLSGTATLTDWQMTLTKTLTRSGLGEPLADQVQSHFRIFNIAASNPISEQVWTAIGPASLDNNSHAGRVTAIAVDPFDPSGNTVYIGAASGGIWKTTNFLTTQSTGPTWIPLTDYGPALGGLHINSITVIPRNGDPRQTIILAATGEGQAQAQFTTILNPETGSSVPGVGFLRSMDGGLTWSLLDSTDNTLPVSSRDRVFVGASSYKIVADPTPTPSGQYILYAAVAGTAAQGGIWRSIDSGNNWQRLNGPAGLPLGQLPLGQGSDVLLDPSKVDAHGNITRIHVALQGGATGGVYESINGGNSWVLLAGINSNPQIRDGDFFGFQPVVPVVAPADTPNGNKGRVVLARPALTGNPAQDLLYSDWLYVAVANAGNNQPGLYVTKDLSVGQNWTQVRLPQAYTSNYPQLLGAANQPLGVSTNNSTSSGGADFSPVANGDLALTLAVDPTNPNIVYLGGSTQRNPLTTDFGNVANPYGGLIRIDLTRLQDAHAAVAFEYSDADGGQTTLNTTGSVTIKPPPSQFSPIYGPNPIPFHFWDGFQSRPYLNLIRDPDNFFTSNSVILMRSVQQFNNNGTGATWTRMDDFLRADPFDPQSAVMSNLTHMVTVVDPVTGQSRLIFGTENGVYTGVDGGSTTGTTSSLSTGIGTQTTVNGSRNGNLQIAQLFRGSAQPSVLAADVAGALFYATSQDNGAHPQSRPDILSTGYLGWTTTPVGQTWPTGLGDPYDSATGVATDPTGSGRVFHYVWARDLEKLHLISSLDVPTAFLQLTNPGNSPVGRTAGLLQAANDPQWPAVVGLDFVFNPINGNALAISSLAGRIFRTQNAGTTWSPIGQPGQLDGFYASALAFGSPDPDSPFPSRTDDFLWAGTLAGNVFVTPNGGGQWFDIDPGNFLDGSQIMEIVPNPRRGVHEAYIITQQAVYFVNFDVNYSVTGTASLAGAPTWYDITGNLFGLTYTLYNDPNQIVQALAPNGLTALAVDWRWQIPDDPADPTGPVHPALYVGGVGGVFRSLDFNPATGTATWTIFPDVANDGAPVDGGYLPHAYVTDLTLSVGNVNPTTGRPEQGAGLNMLVATTYGRGAFAIRLDNDSPYNVVSGPRVVSVGPATTLSTPGLSYIDVTFSGPVSLDTFTVDDVSVIGPAGLVILREITNNNTVAPGQPNPQTQFRIWFDSPQSAIGQYSVVIGSDIEDFSGHKLDQNQNGINGEFNDFFTGTVQVVGFQVLSVTPTSSPTAPFFGPIMLTFSQPVDPTTFSAADDIRLYAPNGALVPVALTAVNPAVNNYTVWIVSFSPLTMLGDYTLDVGPHIQFRAANPADQRELDQNGNGIPGEAAIPAIGYLGDVVRRTISVGTPPPPVTPVPPPQVEPAEAAPLSYFVVRRRRRGRRVILDVQVFSFDAGSVPPLLAFMTTNRKDRIVGGAISRNVLPGRSYVLVRPNRNLVASQDGQSYRIVIRSDRPRPGILMFGVDGTFVI